MRNILFLVLVVSVLGCSVKTTEQSQLDSVATDHGLADTLSGFDERNYQSRFVIINYKPAGNPPAGEIQVIDSTCAIFIYPTDSQLTQMEEKYGVDMETIADDNAYYDSEATMKLDSAGIKTIDAHKRYLQFKGTSASWLLDIRKEGAPEWNLIFFNKVNPPEVVTSVDVTSNRIEQYFSNK
jgi:hypothetical protein